MPTHLHVAGDLPRRARIRDTRILLTVSALLLAVASGSAALADDPDNCLLCHQYRGLGRYVADEDTVHLYFVNPDYHRRRLGAHARIPCTQCHLRSEVGVVPHKPVTPVDCTRQCHLSDVTGMARRFSHVDAVAMLEQSVHDSATLSNLDFEEGPLLNEGQSQCLYCHDEPLFRAVADVAPVVEKLGPRTFYRCNGCHEQRIPVDTEYYLRHVASRLQSARPPLEVAQICGVCHSDPGIRAQYDLEDAVVSYTGTFHGKAALLGSDETADCIACHARSDGDAHLVRSQDNPVSITHPTRKADTCRTAGCHPGADRRIGMAATHMDFPHLSGWEVALAIAFVFFTLVTFGPSLVLTVLELFQVVIGRHVADEVHMRRLVIRVLQDPVGRERLRRFTPSQRIQHWLLALIFGTLVATGFPMKFADQLWARHAIDLFGGLANARVIHRYAGVILVAGFLIHLGIALLGMLADALRKNEQGKRKGVFRALSDMPMFVGPRDLLKSAHLLGYLLFLRKKPPTFGRFTIDQKFEYFGVFWGTMLLGVTGVLLWDAQTTSQWISGRAFNLALIAHTYEAFLAVIHVGILHICNVMFAPQVFPFSPATLTGQTPITRLAEVHGEQVIQVARDLGIRIPPEVEHA